MEKQIKERHLNKNNWAPLHYSAFHDSVKMGELLISKGADINVKDIIHYYINIIFIIIIIEIKERNLINNNKTPLHYALKNKSDKIGELLISKGADINAKDIIYYYIIILFIIIIIEIKERNLFNNNKTPLHYAAEKDRVKIGELLIMKGADIIAKTIIYYYINILFIIMIIEIKEKNFFNNNKTPLHIAAEKDSIKIGELLISKGADINAKDIIYDYIV